jgi:hypothetical protein
MLGIATHARTCWLPMSYETSDCERRTCRVGSRTLACAAPSDACMARRPVTTKRIDQQCAFSTLAVMSAFEPCVDSRKRSQAFSENPVDSYTSYRQEPTRHTLEYRLGDAHMHACMHARTSIFSSCSLLLRFTARALSLEPVVGLRREERRRASPSDWPDDEDDATASDITKAYRE